MEVSFAPSFVRQLHKLELDLQKEAAATIGLLGDKKNYATLEVHKLKGRFAGRYGASVNFKYRIIFQYLSPKEVVLLAIGDHEIYR